MNTKQLIKKLEKITYTATLRKLTKEEIKTIEMSAHRLQNYLSAIEIRK